MVQSTVLHIGQTKRELSFRLKEHENYVIKQYLDKSTIAKHCQNSNLPFNISRTKIIQKCKSLFDLDFYETYYDHKYTNSLDNNMTSPTFLSLVEGSCETISVFHVFLSGKSLLLYMVYKLLSLPFCSLHQPVLETIAKGVSVPFLPD